MSDVKTLSERIDVLETRLAFQDETIETLNQTITAQWQQIDALTRQVAALNERLQEAESAGARPGQRAPAALLRCSLRSIDLRSRREPDCDHNDPSQDRRPHHRCHSLRTPASRRVVGGVIELAVHRL